MSACGPGRGVLSFTTPFKSPPCKCCRACCITSSSPREHPHPHQHVNTAAIPFTRPFENRDRLWRGSLSRTAGGFHCRRSARCFRNRSRGLLFLMLWINSNGCLFLIVQRVWMCPFEAVDDLYLLCSFRLRKVVVLVSNWVGGVAAWILWHKYSDWWPSTFFFFFGSTFFYCGIFFFIVYYFEQWCLFLLGKVVVNMKIWWEREVNVWHG